MFLGRDELVDAVASGVRGAAGQEYLDMSESVETFGKGHREI